MIKHTIQTIPLGNLALAFIPALAIVAILLHWSLNAKRALYAMARMLGQLLLIGYVLTSIFAADSPAVVLVVLFVMVLSSSWITLGNISKRRPGLFPKVLLAVFLGGGTTLVIISQGVLRLDPWYMPQYIIPIAGMIFANSMNSVSLAAERFYAERGRDVPYIEARNIAFQASLIPIMNSLFAVGLVSIPGMMTGQILSGTSPLIAARYQIMVMCMVFAAAGIASAIFLTTVKGDS